MPYKLLAVTGALLVCATAFAQDPPQAEPSKNVWSWGHKIEIRGDYRWSADESHPVQFPTGAMVQTVDPGHHVELNVADLQLDLGYASFAARAKVHGVAKHRRNPTSTDRKGDIDELWVRLGQNPEFLERPERTSFFLQAGKFPKMERQPVRLLESYGLAATSFNRFEDVQVLGGGSVGRNLYWRVQLANGNPLFFRDPNALAGDNGTRRQVREGLSPELGSGFPILYNAETEDLILKTGHPQWGEAVGYRWQRADETLGFDAIVFHYQRNLANSVDLYGTEYGGDLDLLTVGEAGDDIPVTPRGLPVSGRKKEEYGGRIYSEWHAATVIAQYTHQTLAGLKREGWELETGYAIPLALGPIESIQPAARVSGITNHFGSVAAFPAPTIWWQWAKMDAGVRVGLKHGLDVTLEYTKHNIGTKVNKVNEREALVTVRWRV